MNPAEEIVKFWLQENGYFVQSSIQVGRKEIDILAIHKKDKKDRRHIEVTVSIRMVDGKGRSVREWIADYKKRKFQPKKIREIVQERFGSNVYSKEIIVGEIRLKRNKKKQGFTEFKEECCKRGIKAFYFGDVIKEIEPSLKKGRCLNRVIEAWQLYRRFV
ncbi:MAG: hypothetical protein Q7R65_04720 [bacterium]|nr:hypothetical protein [bacterium]